MRRGDEARARGVFSSSSSPGAVALGKKGAVMRRGHVEFQLVVVAGRGRAGGERRSDEDRRSDRSGDEGARPIDAGGAIEK
jgi:hypothetical protein